MTPDQIKAIHVASSKAGLSRAQYETMILKTVGNVTTCKNLTNESFEDCMAVLEDMGGTGGGYYWREKLRLRGTVANARLVWKARQLHSQYETIVSGTSAPIGARHYELAGLVANASAGRTRDPNALLPKEAWNLIESLKKMIERITPCSPPSSSAPSSPSSDFLPASSHAATGSPPISAAAPEFPLTTDT